MSDFIAIPAITVLCYLLAELYKAFVPEEKNKHIPALCGLCGLILGIVCYIWVPGYIPADNIIISAAIGIASGFAATGAHQIFKQEAGKK